MRGDLERTEEAIERVLGGLGEVEPGPGLERRVIAALEESAAVGVMSELRVGVRSGGFGGLSWIASPRLAFGSVVLGAVAVAGVAALWSVGVRHAVARHGADRDRRDREERGRMERPTAGKTAAVPGKGVSSGSLDGSAMGRDPSESMGREAAGLGLLNRVRKPVSGFTRGIRLAGAARDVTAPEGSVRKLASFPAPALPLTEQERLLLRVVHRGDTQEIAMLDPVVRLAEASKEGAEFQEFFEPAVAAVVPESEPLAVPAELKTLLAALPTKTVAMTAPARKTGARPKRKGENRL